MRASPAQTTRATRSPTANDSVLAMRAGSHPTASAASSTVALDVSNSMTRSSSPAAARALRALSIPMALLSSTLSAHKPRATAGTRPEGSSNRDRAGGGAAVRD